MDWKLNANFERLIENGDWAKLENSAAQDAYLICATSIGSWKFAPLVGLNLVLRVNSTDNPATRHQLIRDAKVQLQADGKKNA